MNERYIPTLYRSKEGNWAIRGRSTLSWPDGKLTQLFDLLHEINLGMKVKAKETLAALREAMGE